VTDTDDTTSRPDLGQGLKGTPPNHGQLSRDDLKHMTPEEIAAAKDAGRLDEILGIK
jgi:hypothetical protein